MLAVYRAMNGERRARLLARGPPVGSRISLIGEPYVAFAGKQFPGSGFRALLLVAGFIGLTGCAGFNFGGD
jgi:hypothetical protein